MFILQFMFTLPLISLALAIAEVAFEEQSQQVALLLKLINLICTVVVIQTLINSYLATSEHLWGFGAAKKLLFIKISVGITIAQELVMAFLVSFEVINETHEFNRAQVGVRMLASLVIVEQIGFSFLSLWAYGHRDESLNKAAVDISYADGSWSEGQPERDVNPESPENEPNIAAQPLVRTGRHPCSALRVTFRLRDLFIPPLEEYPSLTTEDSIQDFPALIDPEKERKERDGPLISSKHTGVPDIQERDYDDTLPF